MRRDLSALTEREFELVVVGGGIFGLCAAWAAARRGLSVALLEARDFAHATSASSFKIVHGGVRYLQHGDLVRLRESSAERNVLLRLAPHLVEPLPIAIPTYGHGRRGKAFLAAGLELYQLLAFDRNRGIRDPARRIPPARFLSRAETLDLFPGLPDRGLTGAAVFADAQMYNPPRLGLAFLRSAVEAGAQAANYLEAVAPLGDGSRVTGVAARDALTGDELHVRGKVVLNAAGPWAERLLRVWGGPRLDPPSTYSRDACFVVGRRLTGETGVAVQGRTRDPDALLSREARHLFLVPWRHVTLVGVWHAIRELPADGPAGAGGARAVGGGLWKSGAAVAAHEVTVTDEELGAFIEEVNHGWPALGLSLEDVVAWSSGLVLFGRNEPGATHLSYGKRSRLVDHARDGLEGLVTLVGVRYTTARREGARAADLVCRKLRREDRRSAGARPADAAEPVHGGDIDDIESFLRQALDRRPPGLTPEAMRALARNHGTAYPAVLRHADSEPELLRPFGGSTVTAAEAVHAVREEMAVTLADVVFRRTDLATAGHPGEGALRQCAEVVEEEMGWTVARARLELDEVERELRLRAPQAAKGRGSDTVERQERGNKSGGRHRAR